jgi:DNA primase
MTIDQIKTQLSILDVLGYYGYEQNKNKHINCPFHEDKTPSMKVYEDTNTVYCFSGKCQTHGSSLDAIEFVMKKENCNKHDAIMKCKSMLNYQAPVKKLNSKPILSTLWEEFKSSYKSKLSKAQFYAEKRGIENADLGYNSGRWHNKKGVTE